MLLNMMNDTSDDGEVDTFRGIYQQDLEVFWVSRKKQTIFEERQKEV